MTDALASHFIKVINWYRTWLKALDYGEHCETVSLTEYGIRKTIGKGFRFEVRIDRYGYKRGMHITVCDTRVNNAVSTLERTDRTLTSRINTLSLTFNDINKIFRIATWDTLNLDLEQ